MLFTLNTYFSAANITLVVITFSLLLNVSGSRESKAGPEFSGMHLPLKHGLSKAYRSPAPSGSVTSTRCFPARQKEHILEKAWKQAV